MPEIPDFGQSELDQLRAALKERSREPVEIHLADSELRLGKSDDALTACPAAFWPARDCSFVLFKTGTGEYRCHFHYEPTEPAPGAWLMTTCRGRSRRSCRYRRTMNVNTRACALAAPGRT